MHNINLYLVFHSRLRYYYLVIHNIFICSYLIEKYFDMASVMQLDPTIHRSIAKIPPFQVDPDGKLIGRWKRYEECQNDKASFSAVLQYFPDLFLV